MAESPKQVLSIVFGLDFPFPRRLKQVLGRLDFRLEAAAEGNQARAALRDRIAMDEETR